MVRSAATWLLIQGAGFECPYDDEDNEPVLQRRKAAISRFNGMVLSTVHSLSSSETWSNRVACARIVASFFGLGYNNEQTNLLERTPETIAPLVQLLMPLRDDWCSHIRTITHLVLRAVEATHPTLDLAGLDLQDEGSWLLQESLECSTDLLKPPEPSWTQLLAGVPPMESDVSAMNMPEHYTIEDFVQGHGANIEAIEHFPFMALDKDGAEDADDLDYDDLGIIEIDEDDLDGDELDVLDAENAAQYHTAVRSTPKSRPCSADKHGFRGQRSTRSIDTNATESEKSNSSSERKVSSHHKQHC